MGQHGTARRFRRAVRRFDIVILSEISYTPHRHIPMAGIAPA
jgi:hypothetical protein